jgi:hypothetical protein
MIREDEQEAAIVDAELDAREQEAADQEAAGAAGEPLARAVTEGRPWWESDPRFTGRFRGPESG